MTSTAAAEPRERLEGLSAAEASRLLREQGPNVLVPEARRLPAFLRLFKPLTDPMALLLLVAAPTYLLIGDRIDAVVTLAALAPIVAVNVLLDARAEHALDRLRALTAPVAMAWRDGELQPVPVSTLVPGDLVRIEEGTVIAADGALADGLQLMVDESALTGEAHPVSKSMVGDPGERDLFAGTSVLSGSGMMRVSVTGSRTQFGQVGALVATIEDSPTPLQRLIHRLVWQFGGLAVVVCAGVFAIQLVYGHSVGDAVIAGISLAIAAIPEEFPMVFTLYLGLGAWRLARDNALIRKLAGVEALGAITVICSDKTGTLTLGQMEVGALALDGRVVSCDGTLDERARALLEAASFACEPEPFDPLEVAIRHAAARHGVALPGDGDRLVKDNAFDPAGRYLSHAWRRGEGMTIYAKGAIEGVLAVCRDGPEAASPAAEANTHLASAGMRVLAVAAGRLPGDSESRAADEQHLRYLGLVAFVDPVRPGVPGAIAECREAGIRIMMITGDHPLTARAVAESLGLATDGDSAIVTGAEIEALDEAGRMARLEQSTVFARARPEQKYEVVRALREAGETVAMTGDGINDAPALREADIGVAMGRRGTQVAREAATMVLLDDNFTTIVGAIRDGRRIFENLRRAIAYLVAFHAPLLITAVLVPLLGQPLLLLPIHLVLLELIVHPTVSLVFENDPAPEDLMRRPPRSRHESILRRRDLVRALAIGTSLSAAVTVLYLGALARDIPEDRARAIALCTMVLGQGLMVLVERSPEAPLWRAAYRGTPVLAAVLMGTLATVLAITMAPPVAGLMKLEPPHAEQWAMIFGAAVVSTLWFEPFKRWRAGAAPVLQREP